VARLLAVKGHTYTDEASMLPILLGQQKIIIKKEMVY
jgi:hypothetical protein